MCTGSDFNLETFTCTHAHVQEKSETCTKASTVYCRLLLIQLIKLVKIMTIFGGRDVGEVADIVPCSLNIKIEAYNSGSDDPMT